MNLKKHIVCIVGTRPEAIKMAPVILALRKESSVRLTVLATAQHRGLLDQVLRLFGIVPDIDLDIMQAGQTLPDLTARLITGLDKKFAELRPDAILAQGDTTTVLVAALAAFYRRIPFGHVEAGLRTHNMAFPFPEEMNRVVAGHLARWHFAPTRSAAENLQNEGIPSDHIHVTGNTVIDALLQVAAGSKMLDLPLDVKKRLILVTAHRRENFGKPLENICSAILTLINRYPNVEILYPVHPNPNVRDVVYQRLANQSRIHLCEPLDYAPFVRVLQQAYLILTDSGGVQEEAPALAKPVLVLRAETERPEAVDEGVVRLVGTDVEAIVSETSRLLDDPEAYETMARGVSPYGDGIASERIVAILMRDLSMSDAYMHVLPDADAVVAARIERAT